MRGKDLWFRPIEARIGPDGALYILDFYNQAVIHNDTRGPDHNVVNAAVRPDRDHYFGRIWRIDNKDAKKFAVPDLSKAGPEPIWSKALEHPNRAVRMTASRSCSAKRAGNPASSQDDCRDLAADSPSKEGADAKVCRAVDPGAAEYPTGGHAARAAGRQRSQRAPQCRARAGESRHCCGKSGPQAGASGRGRKDAGLAVAERFRCAGAHRGPARFCRGPAGRGCRQGDRRYVAEVRR